MGKFYQQLSLEERIRLQIGQRDGVGVCALARSLGRSASTISRELACNRAKPGVSTASTARRRTDVPCVAFMIGLVFTLYLSHTLFCV
jgi:IS30 family transposase